ncbi:MAG: hypothetical protein HYW49_02015 [Deltaproteobacteria bacterium]|nr:hypothetical protein [Deltaproteobacteria bacterium]
MACGLMLITIYMSGVSQVTVVRVLSAIFLGSVATEYLRLRHPSLNAVCVRMMGFFMRTHEVKSVSGMPYYAASCLLAIAIFPRDVAILSLLFLTFGDPVASLVGILFRERSIPILKGKSFHGTAAAYIVCALATWLYLKSTGMHGLSLIRMTLLGGFAGALAELLPLDIDDNFTIPLVSGLILWLGFIAIHFA